MAEQSALIRQWIVLTPLGARNDWLAVESLAPELDVNEKTIRRDISTFKTFGFPIEEVASDDGHKSYRLHAHWAKTDLTVINDSRQTNGGFNPAGHGDAQKEPEIAMHSYDAWFPQVTGFAPHDWQALLAASHACTDRLIRIPMEKVTYRVHTAWT